MAAQLNQQELGEKLLAACNVLYSSQSTEAARKGADEWLNSFRCTNEAWMLCHTLLAAPTNVSEEVLYFAAQTLHTKIRSDFEQLPKSQTAALCQSIIQHVCKFSAGPKNVLTKLCLALSALAVRTHSTDMWTRAASNNQRDVIGTLIDTFGQRGDVQSTICLLEVLHVILAEAEDERLEIDDMERDSFDHACCSSSDFVFQYLSHLLQNSGTNRLVHVGIFQCVTAWISMPVNSRRPRLSGTKLISSAGPLIQAIFTTLSTDHLFEVGVDCCLELIRSYWDSNVAENVPIVHLVVPAVMNQTGHLQKAMAENDTETIVGLTRLFAEVGESYMNIIVGEQEINQIAIVQAVLACTMYQDEGDTSVSSMTIRFWRCLGRMLRERKCEQRMLEFNPVFSKVAETCIRRCVLPKEKMLGPLTSGDGGRVVDEREGRRMTKVRLENRIEYGLCLKDVCVDMLGYEKVVMLVWSSMCMALKQLSSLTIGRGGSGGGGGGKNEEDALVEAWCVYEGHLFAAVAAVNHRESEAHPQLQQIGEIITCLTMVANGQFPDNLGGSGGLGDVFGALSNDRLRQHMKWMVQRTSITLVHDETDPRNTSMSAWMKQHPQLMQPMVQLAVHHLVPTTLQHTAYIDLPTLAGYSLLNLCSRCPRNIDVTMIRSFYEHIHQSNGNGGENGRMSTKLRMTIIEALCHVINVQNDQNSGMQFVLLPLAKDLHQATSATSATSPLNVPKVTSLLDIIHIVIRSLKIPSTPNNNNSNANASTTSSPHPLVAAVIQMWSMFELVAGHIVRVPVVQENHEIMLEKLCRVYKYVLRNTDASAIQLLPPMLQQMTTLYGQHPLSPALNMVRICIKDYAHVNDEIGNALSNTFQQFVNHTSNKYLTTIDLMRSNPYLVDDFFLLTTTCVKSKSIIVRSVFDNADMLAR